MWNVTSGSGWNHRVLVVWTGNAGRSSALRRPVTVNQETRPGVRVFSDATGSKNAHDAVAMLNGRRAMNPVRARRHAARPGAVGFERVLADRVKTYSRLLEKEGGIR